MVYFWRELALFGVLNLINIIAVDGGVGMEIVWLGIIGISLVLSFKKPVRWLFSKKYIKPVFWLAITIFLITQSVIIFHGLGLNVPENSDYLIVLGARIRGETPSLALQYRLDMAYDYLEQSSSTKAILTGGQGAGESITEAEIIF
jgi:hypothetical protein